MKMKIEVSNRKKFSVVYALVLLAFFFLASYQTEGVNKILFRG